MPIVFTLPMNVHTDPRAARNKRGEGRSRGKWSSRSSHWSRSASWKIMCFSLNVLPLNVPSSCILPALRNSFFHPWACGQPQEDGCQEWSSRRDPASKVPPLFMASWCQCWLLQFWIFFCAKAGGSWVLLVSWCHQQPWPLSSIHGQTLCWVGKPSSALAGGKAGGTLQVRSVPLVFALTHCRVLGLVQPTATGPIAPLEEAASSDVSSIYAAFH